MAGGELYGDLDRKLVELELVSVDAQACRVVDGLAGKTHEFVDLHVEAPCERADLGVAVVVEALGARPGVWLRG